MSFLHRCFVSVAVAWVSCVACGGGSSVGPAGGGGTQDAGPVREQPRTGKPSTPTKGSDAGASSSSADDASTPGPDLAPAPDEPLPAEPDVLADDGEAPPCARDVTFEAVPLETPPPFDVVIVADHSDSLSWSREDLSLGLESLVESVRGHDARFFVTTPTQYGASSADAINMVTGEYLVPWRDPATGDPYTNEAAEYSVACTDLDGIPIDCPAYPPGEQEFKLQGTWSYRAGNPVAKITSAMTDDEIAKEAARLRDSILALAGNGAQNEQPICTLHRYLDQDPSLLPENVVFVVISDEDDQSSPSECLSGYVYESYPIESTGYVQGCTADCPAYKYSASVPAARWTMSYQCVPVDDFGTTFPDEAVTSGQPLQSTDGCDGVASRACTGGESSRAEQDCGVGTVVENCTTTCNEGGDQRVCLVILDEPQTDPCTQPFEYEGSTYANFADYCNQRSGAGDWNQCVREGMSIQTSTNLSRGGYTESLTQTSSIVDMIASFKSKAKSVFGDRHFVEAIVFAPEFDCVPDKGQSYASNLRYVASTQSDVFPICESYAPALARVEDFSRALLQTEYAFPLKSGEAIDGIEIVNGDGEMRDLDASQYSLDDDGVLRIDPEALTPFDVELTVQVARRCGEAR